MLVRRWIENLLDNFLDESQCNILGWQLAEIDQDKGELLYAELHI